MAAGLAVRCGGKWRGAEKSEATKAAVMALSGICSVSSVRHKGPVCCIGTVLSPIPSYASPSLSFLFFLWL